MRGQVREGEYHFQVNVYDVVHQRQVTSSVTVTFQDIDDDAVLSSGSIRMSGRGPAASVLYLRNLDQWRTYRNIYSEICLERPLP